MKSRTLSFFSYGDMLSTTKLSASCIILQVLVTIDEGVPVQLNLGLSVVLRDVLDVMRTNWVAEGDEFTSSDRKGSMQGYMFWSVQ